MRCRLICQLPSSDPGYGAIARDRARVVATGAVGQDLPRKIYYEKELSFINSRSYGPGRYDPRYEEGGQDYPLGYVRWTEGRNLEAFVDMLGMGRLDVHPLITHRFSIDRLQPPMMRAEGFFLGVCLPILKPMPLKSNQRRSGLNDTGGKPIPSASTVKLGVFSRQFCRLSCSNHTSCFRSNLSALHRVLD
jgi:hypothetical protein